MNKIKNLRNLCRRALQLSFSLVLLATSLPAQAALAAPAPSAVPSYSTQWGSSGTGDGQLSDPSGITTDSAGNVYVADFDNNRIEKFSSAGTYLAQWGSTGTGDGQFQSPYGISADSAGNVYVTDGLNNRIQKFSNSGTYITQWGSAGTGDGQFTSPFGITTDSAGNVYVTDVGNNRIEKFSSAGTYLAQWGSTGTGDGQFQSPYGISADSAGNVYVTDAGNNRIEKFSSAGTYLAQWGSAGTGDGQFQLPFGITADSAGNVYVADTFSNRIQKFSSTGTYLAQWGSAGTGDGQFTNPASITTDSAGNVYVTDNGNNRVEKFTYPPETTPLANAEDAKPVVLATPAQSTMTCSSVIKESAETTQDPGYSYPVGLVNFCFDTPQASNQVSLTFVTNLTPSQVVARKYNPTTGTYTDIPGASITATTYGGQPALLLSYTVIDNGPLDLNPAVGHITDPVGLAVAATGTTLGIPDTGLQSTNMLPYSIATLAGLGFLGVAAKQWRQRGLLRGTWKR